ncbi:MAG: hypothetical protein SFW36_06725 [Leptolyngbyaceae cyanobacterium bins.59]|nr:hypothetical protein [Leptolyngbyaceae cyanobacterium bins.59]
MGFKVFAPMVMLVVLSAAPGVRATAPEDAVLMREATELRSRGTSGLQTFLKKHSQTLSQPETRTALDTLCQQRDCYASQLYWYTDLEQAKAAARLSGKPILSLRLLGKLNEDLSCANSRFFRVALYPNAEVSAFLRDRYILHWESVRPVPQITIDFGDGRKLQRTLTGNSIHYILDASGRPVDALPGLYGPQAFLKHLKQSGELARKVSRLPESERDRFLRQYHRDRLTAVQTQWEQELKQLGIATPPRLLEGQLTPEQTPTAAQAAPIAVTKMMVETPLLRALRLASETRQTLTDLTDQSAWSRLAALHQEEARLDTNSLALIRAKRSRTPNPPEPLEATVRNFEFTMALDTVRNEYLVRSQLHQWFWQGRNTQEVKALNEQVYAQLFLTPSSDPWLGLSPLNSYSAIENDGMKP